MQPQEWITAVTTVGFPIVLIGIVLLGAGKFVNEKAWPFLTAMVKDWQEFERKRAERDELMEDRLVTVIENNTKALQKNVETMQGFAIRLEKVERGHRLLARRFLRHEGKEQHGK